MHDTGFEEADIEELSNELDGGESKLAGTESDALLLLQSLIRRDIFLELQFLAELQVFIVSFVNEFAVSVTDKIVSLKVITRTEEVNVT
jgi:hypothetical protein